MTDNPASATTVDLCAEAARDILCGTLSRESIEAVVRRAVRSSLTEKQEQIERTRRTLRQIADEPLGDPMSDWYVESALLNARELAQSALSEGGE